MSTETDHATIAERPAKSGIETWLGQARSFAERSTRELLRNRTVLFWSVAFPVGFFLLTITIFVDPEQIPAEIWPEVKASTAVTYGMFGAIIASLNAFGQQLAADFEDDRYVLFRSLPIAPSADLAGRFVAGLALSVVAFVAAVVAAVIVGGEFGLREPVSIAVAVVAFVTFTVFWMVVAILIAVVVRDARYAGIITVSIALAAYFLTGYNGGDPSVFAGPDWLLNVLPNTLATRLIGYHLVPTPEGAAEAGAQMVPIPEVGFGLGLLGAYAVGAVAIGYLVVRRGIYERGVLP